MRAPGTPEREILWTPTQDSWRSAVCVLVSESHCQKQLTSFIVSWNHCLPNVLLDALHSLLLPRGPTKTGVIHVTQMRDPGSLSLNTLPRAHRVRVAEL